jgi:ribosomal protein S2
MPYVAGRWIGGSITNFGEIKKRLARLEELSP